MGRGRKRIFLIGNVETGKSTLLKEILAPRLDKDNLIVYDQNGQIAWFHLPELSLDKYGKLKKGKYRVTDPDYKRFWHITNINFKDGIIVAEDITNYIRDKKDYEIMPILIGLRHPRKNCDFIGTCHSIADLPPYMIRNCHEIILKKTNDSWNLVKHKFDESVRDKVEKAFKRVNSSADPYAWERIVLHKTGTV